MDNPLVSEIADKLLQKGFLLGPDAMDYILSKQDPMAFVNDVTLVKFPSGHMADPILGMSTLKNLEGAVLKPVPPVPPVKKTSGEEVSPPPGDGKEKVVSSREVPVPPSPRGPDIIMDPSGPDNETPSIPRQNSRPSKILSD